MKSFTFHLSLVFILAFISCNTINHYKLQSKESYTSNAVTTIPFKYNKKLIVIDAQLSNSKDTHQFIFDTGAFQSKVEYSLSESLNLKTKFKRDNGTAQGIKREIEITSVDSVKIGESKFINIGAGKLKYDKNSYSPCVAKDGIIGANLIKLAHWKIDYQKKEMSISVKPFFNVTPKNSTNIDFYTSFLSGVPKIDIEIEEKTINSVIFDLGYNGGLVLPYEHAKQFSSKNTQTIIDQTTAGIFGSNRDTLLIKNLNLNISGFKTKIPVEFSSLNKALLGNDFLEHFTIYLNYESGKITLKPISKVVIDKPKTFIPGILNDSLWIVNRTNPKIPLQISDTLKSINYLKPIDVFKDNCDYFFNISNLLQSDTLLVEKQNGINIILKNEK